MSEHNRSVLLCREAAEGAGLNVLRLIHEPAAALLAYHIGQHCSSGRRYNTSSICHTPVLQVCWKQTDGLVQMLRPSQIN